MNPKSIPILIAEDNDDHAELIIEALKDNNVVNHIFRVRDGEEALDYLHGRGNFTDPELSRRPQLILLDIRMPRKNGLEVLKEIKDTETLKRIPTVILTTSQKEEEIVKCYHLGAASFITKPINFMELIAKIKTIGVYWILTSELPRT